MRTKSVLLIGLGRFGKYIAMKLHELGHEVMAVDDNEDRINEMLPNNLPDDIQKLYDHAHSDDED